MELVIQSPKTEKKYLSFLSKMLENESFKPYYLFISSPLGGDVA